MVDISAKLDKITEMVDEGLYFTINRARQYGKTTTLSLLDGQLSEKYLVISISFEGTGKITFMSEEMFCKTFTDLLADGLEQNNAIESDVSFWRSGDSDNIYKLGKKIAVFCKQSARPVVLMIDEVDKTSNNDIFLDFLGLLRGKYLLQKQGKDKTFHSVILAGVYDIKNLKLKMASEEQLLKTGEKRFNSLWNIAADFHVDMSFNPDEIATMLAEYENDHRTGMNIGAMANAIYGYTSGYPFLVSKLCKLVDERLEKAWTGDGLKEAVTILLVEENTLFDDLNKNIQNNAELNNLLFDLIISGRKISFSPDDSAVKLGLIFGILTNKNGNIAVANAIFELRITNYLSTKRARLESFKSSVDSSGVVKGRTFDMEICLKKFAAHFHEIYNNTDREFLEKECRLLFITYLKPLINEQGFYHMESQTRSLGRMDLVVDFGKQQFIIEMKKWNGEKAHRDAYQQLWEYLDSKRHDKGFLVTFDFTKRSKRKQSAWIEFKGKKIFDIIIGF